MEQQIDVLFKETRMTPAQVAGLMNSLSRLSTVATSQQRQVLLNLSEVALNFLKACQVKELCMILNSLARKNVRNDKIFHMSSKLLLSMDLNPQDLSVVSNGTYSNSLLAKSVDSLLTTMGSSKSFLSNETAYARVRHQSPVLFDTIALQAISQVQDFLPQGLTNLVNAFSKQKHSHSTLFDAVARQVERCLVTNHGDSFTPQGLANIVNAYAKMNHSDSKMFSAIAEVSIPIIHEFNAQNLSNMANAYAKMNHEHPQLFRAIHDAALDKMSSFKAQELANLANAVVKMGQDDSKARLLQDIARSAIPLLPEFKPQELTMLLNALTKQPMELSGDTENFWKASAKATTELLPDLSLQELSIVANAFSKVNNIEPFQMKLFDKIAALASELLLHHPFQSQNLSNLSNAYAKLNLHAVDMFQVLMVRAIPLLSEMKPQELANFISGIAKLRIEGPTVEELFAETALLLKSHDYDFAPWEQRNMVEVVYAFLKAFQTDEGLLQRIGSELCSRRTLELDAVGLGHLAAALSRTQIACSKELLSAIFVDFESVPEERIHMSNLADICKALPLAYELEVVSSEDMDDLFEWIVGCAIRKRHEASPSDVRDLLLNLTSPRLKNNADTEVLLDLQRSLLVAYHPILHKFSDQIASKHMQTIQRAYKTLYIAQ